MIQIYTGDGKGKTTAAIGLSVRAIGWQKKVSFIQFLKNGESGEVAILKKIGVHCIQSEAPSMPPWQEEAYEDWKEHTQKQYKLAMQAMADCEMLVLDEIMGAMNKRMISRKDMEHLLKQYSEEKELILTGRNAPPWLMDCADLITEMKPIKHYYDRGIEARKGIEL